MLVERMPIAEWIVEKMTMPMVDMQKDMLYKDIAVMEELMWRMKMIHGAKIEISVLPVKVERPSSMLDLIDKLK